VSTAANVHFIQAPPPRVLAQLEARGVVDEEIQIQLAADMADEQFYGERWLVVTDRRILLLSPDGEGSAEIALEEVEEATVEELVGAGRLEVRRKQGPPLSICYSNSLVPIFGEVAQGISQLAKGEEEMSLPTEMVRTRCATCNRLLPEKDGICPFCIRKWNTIMRMVRLLEPYKWRAIALMSLSLIITSLQLLPPLFVRHIIDDVLTPKAGVHKLLLFVVGLVAVRLGFWVFKLADGLLRADLAAWTGRDLRARLYESLQFLPLRFYERRQVGNLMSRFMNDSDRLEMFILFGLPFILNNALMFVGILELLFYMSWSLTLYVLVPIPFIVLRRSQEVGQHAPFVESLPRQVVPLHHPPERIDFRHTRRQVLRSGGSRRAPLPGAQRRAARGPGHGRASLVRLLRHSHFCDELRHFLRVVLWGSADHRQRADPGRFDGLRQLHLAALRANPVLQ